VKPLAADLDAVCRRMRGESRVALAVHEKPDSDALGAAAGMLDLFAHLGAEAHLYVSEDELLPLGDVLLPAERVRRGAPPSGAALYALDSGNPDRLALPDWGEVAVNIDHHHDNPRYGELAFVRGEASSTSELVCDIARALELRPSSAAAGAL
jgi:phosphoesterase RecJ-like protein